MVQDEQKPAGKAGYFLAGLGFIPLIGVPFGIFAIILGMSRGDSSGKRQALLGALGIALTVAIYGSLYIFGFVIRGGIFDKMRTDMAQQMINGVVRDVEFYKVVRGEYPSSLDQLKDLSGKDAYVSTFDPKVTTGSSIKSPNFFYKLTPDKSHYFLRSVGPDGVPFTNDDVLPNLTTTDRQHTGLLLEKTEQ